MPERGLRDVRKNASDWPNRSLAAGISFYLVLKWLLMALHQLRRSASAGSFGIAACIVGGTVGGWLLGYALTIAIASVIGWKAVATLHLLSIHALLAGMGGVAAAVLFEASVSSTIAVVCLTAVLHLPLLIVGLRRIKTIDFDPPTTHDANNGNDTS